MLVAEVLETAPRFPPVRPAARFGRLCCGLEQQVKLVARPRNQICFDISARYLSSVSAGSTLSLRAVSTVEARGCEMERKRE
jgi:hypothetical protein